MLVRSNAAEAQPAIQTLIDDMSAFYGGNSEYYNAATETKKVQYYETMVPVIEDALAIRGFARVAEVGAGRSQLPAFIRDRFPQGNVKVVLHDINDVNAEFYKENQVESAIGSFRGLADFGLFDAICSLFVYEHIPNPAEYLAFCKGMLTSRGAILTVCPHYAVPGYTAPAVRHRGRAAALRTNLQVVASSVVTRVTHKPAFLVETSPAVLHVDWYRDADAVHMVSLADLKAALGPDFSYVRPKIWYGSARGSFVLNQILLTLLARQRR